MNKIYLQGIVSDLEFSHEFYGENFYKFMLTTNRLSGVADVLPCIVSEVSVGYAENGKNVGLCGEVRTRNYEENGKSHLQVYVFVSDFGTCIGDTNYAELQGFICKKSDFRDTPRKRTICDVIFAVNRPTGQSDYIPCIFWGRQAVRVEEMEVGTELSITGRLQSREYVKQNLFGECEIKTAYELSVMGMRGVEECQKYTI